MTRFLVDPELAEECMTFAVTGRELDRESATEA
jgi:hypothetical protein